MRRTDKHSMPLLPEPLSCKAAEARFSGFSMAICPQILADCLVAHLTF